MEKPWLVLSIWWGSYPPLLPLKTVDWCGIREGWYTWSPKDIVLKLLVWLPECTVYPLHTNMLISGFCLWITSWNWGERLDKLSKAFVGQSRLLASHLIHLDRWQILIQKSKWVTLTLQCWRRTLKNHKRSECDCCDYLFQVCMGFVWCCGWLCLCWSQFYLQSSTHHSKTMIRW